MIQAALRKNFHQSIWKANQNREEKIKYDNAVMPSLDLSKANEIGMKFSMVDKDEELALYLRKVGDDGQTLQLSAGGDRPSGTPDEVFKPLSDYQANPNYKTFFNLPFSTWLISGLIDFVNKFQVKLERDR